MTEGNGKKRKVTRRTPKQRQARRAYMNAADEATLAARAAREAKPAEAIQHHMRAIDMLREGARIEGVSLKVPGPPNPPPSPPGQQVG